MHFVFSNRKNEKRYLAKFALEVAESDGLSIALIYGREGVGKSSLIKKAIDEYFDQTIVCEVAFNPCRVYASGDFLQKIALELKNKFASSMNREIDDEFILHNFGKGFVQQFVSSAIVGLSKKIPVLSEVFTGLKKNVDDVEKFNSFLKGEKNLNTDLIKKFILFCVKKQKVCLHIKNFHVIDEASLSILEDFKKQFVHLTILAECVTETDSEINDKLIYKRLTHAFPNIAILEVKALPLEEIYDQIAAQPEKLYSIIEGAYLKEQGNLKDLERILSEPCAPGPLFSISDSNLALLRDLGRGQTILLSIISLEDGVVSKDKLSEIFSKPGLEKYCIQNLLEHDRKNKFVIEKDGKLFIDHDSTLRRILSDSSFAFERQYAARALLEHAQSQNIEKKTSVKGVLYFLRLSIICNDFGLATQCISDLSNMFTVYNVGDDAVSIICDYVNRLKISDPDNCVKIATLLVPLLLENKLIAKAIPITEHIFRRSLQWRFIHIIGLLSVLDMQRVKSSIYDCEQFIKSKLNNDNINAEIAFLMLLKVWLFRLQGDFENAQTTYSSIDVQKLTLMQAAFVYRYAEIAGCYNTVDFLKKALFSLKDTDAPRLKRQIKMSLIQELSDQGKNKEAIALIEMMRREKGLLYFERYCLENNDLACRIRMGLPVETSTLESLARGVADPFDRLIIENNILLAEAIGNHEEEVLQRSARIQALISISDHIEPNMKKISLLNISVALKRLHIHGRANSLWREMLLIKSDIDVDFWNISDRHESVGAYIESVGMPFFASHMTDWFISPSIFLPSPE